MTALPDWNVVSDAELAVAAAGGDRGAFAGIYDRYADRLYDYCVGTMRDRDAAADCVQDVFCAAAVDLPKLREPDKLRPWLYSIARHQALRAIRERRREPVTDELNDEPSRNPGPDTLVARNELATLVAAAAGGLSDRDREVLELTYRHGLNGSELAEALGVSHESAKKLVQRLRDTVERSLGALLVARRGRTAPTACAALATTLQGWDGQFNVLIRKRVARHIESCSNCDQERRNLVNPVALLGGAPIFTPAPAWLREATLSQVDLPRAGGKNTAGLADEVTERFGPEPGDDGRGPFFTRRLLVAAALLVGIPLAALGITIGWQQVRDDPVAPSDLVGPVTTTASTTPPRAPAPPPKLNSPPPQSISSTPTPVPVVPVAPPTVQPTTTQAPTPAPDSPTPEAPPSSTRPPVKSCPDGSTVPAGRRCPEPEPEPEPEAEPEPEPEPERTNCPNGSTVPAGQTCPIQGLPGPRQPLPNDGPIYDPVPDNDPAPPQVG